MFTFIAICTILGIKEYGYKKLVSRVLIIAVLMNFSLLFAKLVIDGSNFTAYQFYSQMNGGQAASPDIAAAFLKPMGITSVWNDTKKLTDAIGQTTNSGGQAFLFGLVGGILLLMIALVLFYGVILMAARGVALVIIMLTSAVAFATYLIPSFAGSKYGWKGWWEALINCAVFAPLLMLFLYIAQLLLGAVTPNSVNLGSIISDPTQLSSTSAWTTIMTYIFTVGLLFVALKISSTFASMAGGLSLSSLIPSASSFGGVTGLIGRNTLGTFGYRRSNNLSEQAKEAKNKAGSFTNDANRYMRSGNEAAAKVAEREAQRFEKIAAKRQISAGRYAGLADTKFGGKTSVVGKIDERTKAATKIAEKLAPSDEDKKKVRDDAAKTVIAERQPEKDKLVTTVEKERVVANESKKEPDEKLKAALSEQERLVTGIDKDQKKRTEEELAMQTKIREEAQKDPNYAPAQKKVADKEQTQKNNKTVHDEKVKNLDAQITAANKDTEKQNALKKQLIEAEESRKTEMTSETRKIEEARKAVTSIESSVETGDSEVAKAIRDARARIASLNADIKKKGTELPEVRRKVTEHKATIESIQKPLADAEASLKTYENETQKLAKTAGEERIDAHAESTAAAAAEIGRRQGSLWTRFAGKMTNENEIVAKKVRGNIAKKVKPRRVSEQIKELNKQVREEEGDAPEPAPAAPGATPPPGTH